MALSALNFRFNNNTYSLPVNEDNSLTVGTYGSLVLKGLSLYYKAILAPYKDTSKTVVYSNGNRRYYYSANYPSIHCRKNNTNYSCCNNYQNYATYTWTFDYAYSGSSAKTVSYATDSYLGSSYNKYTQQTKLAPYGMVTPSRSGYTFKGWNTKADDTGTSYKSTLKKRSTGSNATFYALWAKIDAGTYSGNDFLFQKLLPWFDDSFSTTAKTSNHIATLTINSSTVNVKVGSTFKPYHSINGLDHHYGINIDGTDYMIRYTNWLGQNSDATVVISNGWLTDK